MKRHLAIFTSCFVLGAAAAFVARAALHEPHTGRASATRDGAPAEAAAEPTAAAENHEGHAGAAAAAAVPAPVAAKPAADQTPVNTICAICGMKVNSKIPNEIYQGKKVGFGCGACPAMFRADPDKYGPAALRNEVVED